MGLFNRRRDNSPTDPNAAITAFWDWWSATGRATADAAIESGDPHSLVEPMSAHVSAISADLAWEFGNGAGLGSRHELTVTAEGNADVRALARRWLRAAPPADETWAFTDLKQRAPDVSGIDLRIGEESINLGDVQIGARVVGNHVDVTVHHPVFEQLDEGSRQQIAYLALDSSVGEAAVESWLGEISASEVAPIDGFPLTHFAAFLDDHASARVDEEGNPSWVLLQGTGPSGPVRAMAQVPLSSVTAPDLETHLAIRIPYSDQTEAGFPGPASLEELRALEDHLTERLGETGRLVAQETSKGWRTLHAFVDGAQPAAETIRAAVTGWTQGTVQVDSQRDPGWEAVAHLRS